MIGRALRHEEELLHIKIEGKMNAKEAEEDQEYH